MQFLTFKQLCPEHVEWKDRHSVPNAVGWELNRGRKVPRSISLAKSLDPTRYLIFLVSVCSVIEVVIVKIYSLAFPDKIITGWPYPLQI